MSFTRQEANWFARNSGRLYGSWKQKNGGHMGPLFSRFFSVKSWRDPAPWLGVSLGLVFIPVIIFASSSMLLLAGVSINMFSSWLILALALGLALWSAKKVAGAWLVVVPICLCAVIAIYLSHDLVDTSYDGQEYHFSATYALSHGWDPVRSPFPTAPWGARDAYSSEVNWINHYPQASWLSSAVLMVAGIGQEASKGVTVLLAEALLFALVSYGIRIKLAPWKILLFSGVLAANPIIIDQLGTRMNDGILAACFGLTAVYALLWISTRERLCAVGMCAALIFGLNLKFSAVPMLAFLCALLIVGAWLRGHKPEAKRLAVLAIGAACVAIFVLGFHPYVTNTINFHHPFYPIMGPHKVDIISEEYPNGFQNMPPWLRAFMSYFSRSGSGYQSTAVLKIPFSLSGAELNALAVPDARFGGFGPLFSGALVLTLALAAAIVLLEHNNGPALTVLGAAGGVLAIAIAMPEAWWARFNPYVWWIPGLAGLSGLYCKHRTLNALGVVVAATLLVNSALTAYFTLQPSRWRSEEVRYQIAEMRSARQPVLIYYGNSPARFALIAETGARIIPSSSPLPPSCEPRILAYAFPMDAHDPRPSYCIASSSPSQKPVAARSKAADSNL